MSSVFNSAGPRIRLIWTAVPSNTSFGYNAGDIAWK